MTGDDFTLIELHKMASECGDGLIPELLDALRYGGGALAEGLAHGFDGKNDLGQARVSRAYPASSVDNVIAFPIARRGMTRR